jgi:hypothetical protein
MHCYVKEDRCTRRVFTLTNIYGKSNGSLGVLLSTVRKSGYASPMMWHLSTENHRSLQLSNPIQRLVDSSNVEPDMKLSISRLDQP